MHVLGLFGSHFFKVFWTHKSAEEMHLGTLRKPFLQGALWQQKSAEEMHVWDSLEAVSSRCSGATKEC